MRYFWATIRHKWFVFLAGLKLGLPLWRAIVHDWSKFLPSELPHYNRQFFGAAGDLAGFGRAWHHHIVNNSHHPEHWTYIDANGEHVLEMSEIAITEMIVDWWGAGRSYNGSWDMQDWLSKNLSKKRLHPQTRIKVESFLCEHELYLPGDVEAYPQAIIRTR